MAKKKREQADLVEQLKEAIQQSGRTLLKLSEDSGVSAGQLSRFVRGVRTLTLPAASRVCRALGLHLAGGDKPPATEEVPKRVKKGR
jgi:transcriptional regulator with XRE-family HTH domain